MRPSLTRLLTLLLVTASPAAAQLSSTGNQILQQGSGGLVDEALANDRFGKALAVGDFDDDGFDDLAIGVPGDNFRDFPHLGDFANDTGAVHIVYGSAQGLVSLGNATFAQQSGGDISGFPEDDDEFGSALSAFDVNGDGADDLLVGEPGSRESGLYWTLPDAAGSITVLLGASGEGIVDTGSLGTSQTDMPECESAEENDRFGGAVQGIDGTSVIFAASPNEGVETGSFGSQGRVHRLSVNSSSITGGCGSADLHQNIDGISGSNEDGDRFGAALGQGDFNDDSIADLVIGVPGEDMGSIAAAGSITILPGNLSPTGSPRWLPTDSVTFNQNSADLLGAAAAGDRWGSAFASADFDRDGFGDLAIGAPGDDNGTGVGAGVVQVLYGSPEGLNGVGDQIWSQAGAIVGGPEAGDLFGSALAAGDFDGDGAFDLAVGVPGENFTAPVGSSGAVTVIYGRLGFGLDFPDNQFFDQDSAGLLDTAEPGDTFGQALAVGDFNHDGRDDLAVGVPGENGARGLVHVLYGSEGGILGEAEFTTSNVMIVGESSVTLSFPVRRIGPLNLAATVSHRVVAGSSATPGVDFIYTAGTVSWEAGESADKSITFSVRPDKVNEPIESFALELHSPSAGFGLGTKTRRTVQINAN
jgi:hypothetical protein